MFWWSSKKRVKTLEEGTKRSFSDVKSDIKNVGKWIKHLDNQDKVVFNLLSELKEDLSSVKIKLHSLQEDVNLSLEKEKAGLLVGKKSVYGKQTGVEGVQEAVQTAVQTANFYDILQSLSESEKVVIFTLLNTDMKLSYEDLALILGKEKSTIRGQINSIKQKSGGLLEEIRERNGKKRVYIPEKIRKKLEKYAKVRVKKRKKTTKIAQKL